MPSILSLKNKKSSFDFTIKKKFFLFMKKCTFVKLITHTLEIKNIEKKIIITPRKNIPVTFKPGHDTSRLS